MASQLATNTEFSEWIMAYIRPTSGHGSECIKTIATEIYTVKAKGKKAQPLFMLDFVRFVLEANP